MQNIFDLRKEDPTLFKDVLKSFKLDEKSLKIIDDPSGIDGSKDKIRFKNHKRSRYLALGNNNFLAIKGTINDVALYENDLNNREENPLGNNNTLEMFPMIEGKIPYQCLKSELDEESRKALEFINAYLKVFKSLPNIPIPLAIFEHGTEYRESAKDILSSFIPKTVQNKVDKILSDDSLGAAIYLYSNTPLRVMDLRSEVKLCQPYWGVGKEQVLNSWCQQFVRALLLEIVPASKWSIISGNCLSAQNMTLGGGWSDTDSLVRFDEFKNTTVLIESIMFSLEQMCETVFIALDRNNPNQSMKGERKVLIKAQLFSLIGTMIKKEAQSYQLDINPVVEEIFLDCEVQNILKNQELLS